MKKKRHARVERILEGLATAYPDACCELNSSNPLELLVATILSAQCTDTQVNLVTVDLFKKYRTARDYAEGSLAQLENAVSRIGLFRAKAKNIQQACRMLLERHHGEVPRTMEDLIELPGVGRKTANVVLGNAYGISEGVVVDTHVARLSIRLGLTVHENPEKIEHQLMEIIPQEEWILFSHRLIWHGRRCCKARKPECGTCSIRKLCPSAGSFDSGKGR